MRVDGAKCVESADESILIEENWGSLSNTSISKQREMRVRKRSKSSSSSKVCENKLIEMGRKRELVQTVRWRPRERK